MNEPTYEELVTGSTPEPTYNELILKRINAVMANQSTPEVAVYEDAFACIRNISHDRDEALPVSEMGELKRKIMAARRALSTDGKNSEAQRLYELLLRCWCYESPHLFESYLFYTEHKRPFAKQFFLPRYRQLKDIVNGLQDLADDKLDLLAVSLPPGAGKSTLALFYLTWLAGRNPEKPILTGSHANSFLSGAYSECLRMMDPEGEYCWHDCFPELKVISTNAKDMLIDIGRDKRDAKRFTTLEFSSIGSGNAGKVRAENLLYCDDLVSSLEESMSADRMEKLWQAYTVDLRQRKIGNCKELHIATRWSVRDVIGRLDALYEDDPRARFIVKPALNENDESNFDYPIEAGFTTEFYHQQRAMMDDASWKALYMNQPIEREGLLYQEDELRRYFELPDGEPDAIISVCDTKDRGQDYCVMPVAYVYGNDYYIEDVLCDNSAPDVVEPRLVEICLRNRIQMSRFESNSAGGKVAEKIQQLIKERNGITRITTKYTTAQKETKIIINSPWIQEHCLFKDKTVIQGNKEYNRFLNFMCTYTLVGKNKHDDVPDALAMLSEFAQSFNSSRVEIIKRPW